MIDTESFQSVNTISSTSKVFQKCNCFVKVLKVWWLTPSHFNLFIALKRTKGSVPTLFIPSRISLLNSLLFVLIAITFGISFNFFFLSNDLLILLKQRNQGVDGHVQGLNGYIIRHSNYSNSSIDAKDLFHLEIDGGLDIIDFTKHIVLISQ